MSYPTHVKAMICYIEANVKGDKFNYEELEQRMGFSRAHLRDLFRKSTGMPLAQYVRMRKIKNSASDSFPTKSKGAISL